MAVAHQSSFELKTASNWITNPIGSSHGQSSNLWLDYRRIKVVGKGAFGTVTLYEKVSEKSLVVFKEIDLQNSRPADRRKAIFEADVLSSLNHANIVSYLGSFEEAGKLFIVMEYCENGSLADFLANQKSHLSEKLVLKMFRQIASALEYLEFKNILHRDLKTANILIAKGLTLKVGDFGIAHVLSAIKTDASTVIGTPFSFSPEICEGLRYTNKSDIWAAGCILYEMVTLQKTFDSNNMPGLVRKILKGHFAPIRGNYSSGLRKLIKDLLALSPDLRPRAVDLVEMVDDLMNSQETLLRSSLVHGQCHKDELTSMIFEIKVNNERELKLEHFDFDEHVVQMCKSATHGLLLTGHGQVYFWDYKSKIEPKLIPELSHVVKISAGDNFSVFLNQNGIVSTMGSASSNCLGEITGRDFQVPKVLNCLLGIDVIDIVSSSRHVLICSSNGSVYGWGHNDDSCLGQDPGLSVIHVPLQIEFPKSTKIVKIFAHDSKSLFIDTRGQVWILGNRFKNINNNLKKNYKVDKSSNPIKLILKQFAVSATLCSGSTRILLRGGKVLLFGGRETRLEFESDIQDVKNSENVSLAMTQNQVYFSGFRNRVTEEQLVPCDSSPCYLMNEVAIGGTDVSLMDIVQNIGPDQSVILVKDPKVKDRTMTFQHISGSRTKQELIVDPQLVVALYPCPFNKRELSIHLSQINVFHDDSMYVTFDLKKPHSPKCDLKPLTRDLDATLKNPESTKTEPESEVPDWILKELESASDDVCATTEFRRPKVTPTSDPTFDRKIKNVTKKLLSKSTDIDLRNRISNHDDRFSYQDKNSHFVLCPCCIIL